MCVNRCSDWAAHKTNALFPFPQKGTNLQLLSSGFKDIFCKISRGKEDPNNLEIPPAALKSPSYTHQWNALKLSIH